MNDGQAIAKVGYSHDAIIDVIVAKPEVTQGELCAQFGYTPGWMSRVINSDAFQNRLAARRGELVDPVVTQGLNERLRAVSTRSADVILEALDEPNPSKHLALEALKISARAQHYGAKMPRTVVQVNVQNNTGSRSTIGGGLSDRPMVGGGKDNEPAGVVVGAQVIEEKQA